MENEENVVRLAKPIRKGLLRLIFSRFFVIILLLVLRLLRVERKANRKNRPAEADRE